MRTKAIAYKVLKTAIDQRGPINYHNAMSVAAEVAIAIEKEIREEGGDTPEGPVEAE